MNIQLNGEQTVIENSLTALKLLEKNSLNPSLTVVEINAKILKPEQLTTTIINENDSIELIRFIGGG